MGRSIRPRHDRVYSVAATPLLSVGWSALPLLILALAHAHRCRRFSPRNFSCLRRCIGRIRFFYYPRHRAKVICLTPAVFAPRTGAPLLRLVLSDRLIKTQLTQLVRRKWFTGLSFALFSRRPFRDVFRRLRCVVRERHNHYTTIQGCLRSTTSHFPLWSGQRGSNPQHSAWKADAPPFELCPLIEWRRFSGSRSPVGLRRPAALLIGLPLCLQSSG